MLVTAYCPCTVCCGPDARGVTASGRPVSFNGGKFVAADRALPFGTRLVIPGYNDGRPVEVIDRGGAIRGDHVDVFFPTHEEARRWGRQYLTVGESSW
jgi:3D (Asp-Asp-Asp) domain-containing protein